LIQQQWNFNPTGSIIQIEDHEASPSGTHMSPNRLSNLTIVVVEDHDDARRYLGLFLNQIGGNVVLARNGFEGLEALLNGTNYRNNVSALTLSAIGGPHTETQIQVR